MTLTAVGERVRSLRAADALPETAYALASLLFQAVRFQRAGRPLYLLATEAARTLTGARFEPRRRAAGLVQPPAPAGYLQLPRHLVWTEAAPPLTSAGTGAGGAGLVPGRGAPGRMSSSSAREQQRAAGGPESVDGVFWSLSRTDVLHALPISGLLPDRPGFAALPLPGAPLSDAPLWLDATARPSGPDFASALPGGELDELYAIQTAGEVLKLLARFFVLTRHGGALLETRRPGPAPGSASGGESGPGGADAGRRAGTPRPSALPYTLVSLADRAAGSGET
jgi:hypothetical protein